MFRLPIIFILLLLTTYPAQTQWADWERLPGPTGGMVSSFAGVVNTIVAAPLGGALYRSTDDGVTWEFLYDAGWTASVQKLHGSADSMLYALGYGGAYRSSDRGQSWTKCAPGGMALFVTSDIDGTVLLGLRGEVAASSDKGATWTKSIPAPGGTRDYKVAMDKHGRWYAGAYQTGVFRSTDRGQSWESIDTDLPSNAVYSLSTTEVGGLFVGLNNATYLSTDFGSTWVEIAEFRGGNTFDIQQAGGGVLLAITTEGNFRSTDWGTSWTGDTTLRSTMIFARDDGTVLMSSAGRVFRSTDRGATFAVSDAGLYVQNISAIASMESGAMLVGCENGGLYFSPDEGESWEFVETPAGWGYSVQKIEALNSYRDSLFADVSANVLADGVILQHPRGATEWTVLEDSLGGQSFLDVWGTMWMRAVTTDGRILQKNNFGMGPWEEYGRIQPPSGNINAARLIQAEQPETVWLCATDRGLYRCSHNGSTWDPVLIDGLPIWLTDIAYGLVSDGYGRLWYGLLYACSADALYASDDAGLTWIRDTLDLNSPRELEFNRLGDFYFLDDDIIRFRSRLRFRKNWQEFPALPFGGAKTLTFGGGLTSQEDHLLIGTRTHGILRSTASTMTAPAAQAGPSSFTITGMYPLPLSAEGRLHVQLELQRAGDVRVEICDVLGRVLQRHERGVLPAGSSDFTLPVAAHAAAMLLLRVHGPGGTVQRALPVLSARR